MADKEFTQICKEILGLSKRLEGIEPAELRKIKSDIEKINEAIAADKASFEAKKEDFDGKYSGITEIINTFDELKSQIERVLKSGAINDGVETSVSTFSSKKITALLNKAKSVIDEKIVTLSKSGITAWDTTLEYPIDAVTVFNGKLYRAKTQNTGKKPSENQDEWEAAASEEWSKKTFLKLTDAIDAYSKLEADGKFMEKKDFPVIDKAYVGLGEVDNTADSDKPISRATQEALDGITTLLNGKANAGEIPNIVRNSLNGLIFQQGTVNVTCDSSGNATVLYPIAFPVTPIFVRYTYSGLSYYNILTLSYPDNQHMDPTKLWVLSNKRFSNQTITVTYAALGY
nr:MAG TPA: Baseplate structural protein [Caudoviricetes sp.]